MLVCQLWTFHIILLILWSLLAIDDFRMTSIWLRFRSGPYTIIYVCLSISAQLCCKIEIISLWVHLNGIPTCVIFANLSWPSMIQYSTNNHASSYIVVTSNFPNPDCIGPVKYSGSYIILSFLPSEWTWHCVYPIWPCSGFSMPFQDKIFHESPIIFQDEYLIGSIINYSPIPYIYWLGCINLSLL